MSLISDLFETRSHPANPDKWFLRWIRGNETESGVTVDDDTALSSTAIFAGVRLLSEALATVPCNVYRVDADRNRRDVHRENPLHQVLHANFNPELTAAEGRAIMLANAIFSGNGYAEAVRDGTGRVRELWPIWPHRITPSRTDTGQLVYVVKPPSSAPVTLLPEQVFHIRGFSLGGLVGLDTIQTMRDSVGLTIAAERFGTSFFARGDPERRARTPGDAVAASVEESRRLVERGTRASAPRTHSRRGNAIQAA